MKNLMVYVSPDHDFNEEYATLIKLQIDNSLDLGWKPEDILIVTNFEFEYGGIKAVLVGDEHFCALRPRSIKTTIIPYLVISGIVKDGEIYWNHDLDAIQMNVMDEKDLGMDNIELGMTDYGWKSRWCMGSFFFKSSTIDIFKLTKDIIFKNIEDEIAMSSLTDNNTNDINNRSKRLNITYNVGQRKPVENFTRSEQPVKVVHFHPNRKRVLDVFMGANGTGKPLLTERLINIFKKYGFEGE